MSRGKINNKWQTGGKLDCNAYHRPKAIFINTKRHLEDKWVKLKEDMIREYEGITFFHFLRCDNV